MTINNPRFPHTCVIWRQIVDSPLVDEKVSYDPLADEIDVSAVDSSEETNQQQIVYQGPCRAYDKHTTSDRGEVITSFRGLSLPLNRDDWAARGVIPMEGDEIRVNRGGYEEYGRVIDKNPANFHGTHIVWRYGRN